MRLPARFAREGAWVVVADVNETDGSALVAQLKSEGLEAKFVRTDVSKECSVKALYDVDILALRQIGRVL